MLGKTFGGILISDRHSSYNWVELTQRQLCWAHLRRDFIKISERPGVSKQLGEALVKQQEKLFELWHRVRDGTSSRAEFIAAASLIRAAVQALLQEAAAYEIGSKEKTPLAHTVRTCRQLLKVEPAMWLFVTVEGVEPTNNAAERAIRPAVLWRRTSFGSQSVAGSTFVARMSRGSHHCALTETECVGVSHACHLCRSQRSTRSIFTSTNHSCCRADTSCCLICHWRWCIPSDNS